MSPLLISIAAFFGVAALVGGVAMLLRGDNSSRNEDRLALLTGAKSSTHGNSPQSSVLYQPLETTQNALVVFLSRFQNLSLLFLQADTTLTPSKFFGISGVMALAGSVAGAVTGITPAVIPV